MASDVYFANFRSRKWKDNRINKIKRLFDAAGFEGIIAEKDLVAVKLHFGERGNDTFLQPVFVRQVVDKIKKAGGKPFLTDTNTLYTGSRKNAVDHLITAYEHGFVYSVVGAPVIIADGLRSESVQEVEIKGKHVDRVQVARDVASANAMVVLSHFKGHELAGFGGAIKNLAMGCATAAGKKEQHSAKFFVKQDECTGCGTCQDVCPVGAPSLEDSLASIEKDLCIGCGECMVSCPVKAIDLDWATDIAEFMERMTEYALGAAKSNEGKTAYINFVNNVTPDCDCINWSDAPMVPDVGILASYDPVALDQACLDLVNKQQGIAGNLLKKNLEPGQDKFAGVWGYTQGSIQLTYGQEIGLGSTSYNIVEL